LVGVDLATNKVVRTILFPPDVVLRNTYLNDIRFDLRQGKGGIAYITDSGASGIIVVEASGRSWRRLAGDRSTVPDASFVPFVEGDPLAVRLPGKSPTPRSLINRLEQLLLLWGVLVGVGTGLSAIVLGATIVHRWFDR
jgi:hypothetical protein